MHPFAFFLLALGGGVGVVLLIIGTVIGVFVLPLLARINREGINEPIDDETDEDWA